MPEFTTVQNVTTAYLIDDADEVVFLTPAPLRLFVSVVCNLAVEYPNVTVKRRRFKKREIFMVCLYVVVVVVVDISMSSEKLECLCGRLRCLVLCISVYVSSRRVSRLLDTQINDVCKFVECGGTETKPDERSEVYVCFGVSSNQVMFSSGGRRTLKVAGP